MDLQGKQLCHIQVCHPSEWSYESEFASIVTDSVEDLILEDLFTREANRKVTKVVPPGKMTGEHGAVSMHLQSLS